MDLVLMPEVEARRMLGDRRIRLHVHVPYGSWTGCGKLRVLRLTLLQAQGDSGEPYVEMIVGYEAYQA
ncbi:MAG: hypothetical protein JO113_05900 [Candidatus Eremiobacteraeota bacterium]|nr:hypothetical protein [Candidatus Eremiobacteraeota bacterium]